MTNLEPRKRDLPALADEIRREHEAVEAGIQATVAAAIRCGELLAEAKARVQHGDWYSWLEANFPSTPQTAAAYMRLAGNREQIEHASSIRGALKQLAAPQPEATEKPDEVGEEPKREDFGEGDLDTARYYFALIEYQDNRRLAAYDEVVANASELAAEDPVEGPLLVAYAGTGIAFITANRAVEDSSEGDYDENYAAARKAWLIHRQARDTWYVSQDEPPMDERPVDFFDAMYHPLLQRDEDAA